MDLVFLGTGGSVPTARRSTACLLARVGGDRLLFDCGEGSQRQMQRSTGLVQVDEIFVTHLHADHYLGIPGLLKTYDLNDRERPLRVYGPPGPDRAVQGAAADLRPDRLRGRAGRARARARPCATTATRCARSRSSTGCAPTATRSSRTSARAASTPRRQSASGVPPGPDFKRLQDGERGRGQRRVGRPEQVMGEPRARAQARDQRRHGALRDDPGRRPRGAAARPRRELRRRGERARRRDRPLDRPPGGRARRARPGSSMLALVHISSRYDVRAVLAEAQRGVPAQRSRRATSTWSRSRSPSAASRGLVEGGARAAPATRARPTRASRHDPRRAPRPPPARRVAAPPRPAPRARAPRPLSGVDDRRPARGRLRRRRHLRGARRARRPRARDAERARRRDDRRRRPLLPRRRRRRSSRRSTPTSARRSRRSPGSSPRSSVDARRAAHLRGAARRARRARRRPRGELRDPDRRRVRARPRALGARGSSRRTGRWSRWSPSSTCSSSARSRARVVGFRFPDYARGLEAEGYHLHFISADREPRRPRARAAGRREAVASSTSPASCTSSFRPASSSTTPSSTRRRQRRSTAPSAAADRSAQRRDLVGDRVGERRRLVLLEEVLGRQQHRVVDAEHLLDAAQLVEAERRVALAPDDPRRVGALGEAVGEEVAPSRR